MKSPSLKNAFATLCISFVAAGCAPPLILPPVKASESVRTEFLEPKVGVVATREVGESLLFQGISTKVQEYTVTTLDEASSRMDLGHSLSLPAGTTGPLERRYGSDIRLLCALTRGAGTIVSGKVIGCLVDTDKDGKFDKSMFSERDKYFPLDEPVRYELKTVSEKTIENAKDFHMDVLYQGVSKGEIKVSYREFKGGLARPAFTQDVTYELENDDTGVISFKGMRIKVLKATRENITYVVERLPNI